MTDWATAARLRLLANSLLALFLCWPCFSARAAVEDPAKSSLRTALTGVATRDLSVGSNAFVEAVQRELGVTFDEADGGEKLVPGIVSFLAPGSEVITALSLEPAPFDVSGTLSVDVILDRPEISPPPPDTIGHHGQLVVTGISFPGVSLDLVVDDVVVQSTVPDEGGGFSFDQYFGSDGEQAASESETAPEAPQSGAEEGGGDTGQSGDFQDWLKGLKS